MGQREGARGDLPLELYPTLDELAAASAEPPRWARRADPDDPFVRLALWLRAHNDRIGIAAAGLAGLLFAMMAIRVIAALIAGRM